MFQITLTSNLEVLIFDFMTYFVGFYILAHSVLVIKNSIKMIRSNKKVYLSNVMAIGFSIMFIIIYTLSILEYFGIVKIINLYDLAEVGDVIDV